MCMFDKIPQINIVEFILFLSELYSKPFLCDGVKDDFHGIQARHFLEHVDQALERHMMAHGGCWWLG